MFRAKEETMEHRGRKAVLLRARIRREALRRQSIAGDHKSYSDLRPEERTKVEVEVHGRRASLYINVIDSRGRRRHYAVEFYGGGLFFRISRSHHHNRKQAVMEATPRGAGTSPLEPDAGKYKGPDEACMRRRNRVRLRWS